MVLGEVAAAVFPILPTDFFLIIASAAMLSFMWFAALGIKFADIGKTFLDNPKVLLVTTAVLFVIVFFYVYGSFFNTPTTSCIAWEEQCAPFAANNTHKIATILFALSFWFTIMEIILVEFNPFNHQIRDVSLVIVSLGNRIKEWLTNISLYAILKWLATVLFFAVWGWASVLVFSGISFIFLPSEGNVQPLAYLHSVVGGTDQNFYFKNNFTDDKMIREIYFECEKPDYNHAFTPYYCDMPKIIRAGTIKKIPCKSESLPHCESVKKVVAKTYGDYEYPTIIKP